MNVIDSTILMSNKRNADGTISVIFRMTNRDAVDILTKCDALPASAEIDSLEWIKNAIQTNHSALQYITRKAVDLNLKNVVAYNAKAITSIIPYLDRYLGAAIDWMRGETWDQAIASNTIAAIVANPVASAVYEATSESPALGIIAYTFTDAMTSDYVDKLADNIYQWLFVDPHADFSLTIPQEVAALYDRNGNLNEYIESLRVNTAQKCEALVQHLEESQNTINDVDGFWKNYLSSTFAGEPIENLAAANNTSVGGLLENSGLTSPLQVYLGDDVTITTEDGDKRLTLVDTVFLDALAASQGWASAEVAYAQLNQNWFLGSLSAYDSEGYNWLPADIYAAYAKDNALTGGMTAGMFDKYTDIDAFRAGLYSLDGVASDLADSFSLDNFSDMGAMFGQSTQTADFLVGDVLYATINSTGGGGDWDLDWNWKSGSDNGSYDAWDINQYYDYSSILDTGGSRRSGLYSNDYWESITNTSYDYITTGYNSSSDIWHGLNYDIAASPRRASGTGYTYTGSSFYSGPGRSYTSYSGYGHGSDFSVSGSWSNSRRSGFSFSFSFSFPIAIDLDNDGDVTLVSLEESSVFFDMDGDEYKENTGWVAANDGILVYDMDGDQEITKAKELSFKLWSDEAETDFDGLRLMFDTSGNNKLDSADENFDKFYIWQDLNQDGQVDAGELSRLLLDYGEVAERIKNGSRRLKPGEWRCGGEKVVMDVVAPFGGGEEMVDSSTTVE